MNHIELTYTMGNQKTFDTRPNTVEGIKSAMREVTKRERMGWKCEPSLIVLKHKLEHAK